MKKLFYKKKITDECNCYLQEKQNLEFFREKRARFSKKYQKCKKTKKSKKCVRIYDKLKFFAEKATKQRKLRNKKNVDCSGAKLKYTAFLKQIIIEKKKYASIEFQLEIKERTTLTKRFESWEIKYKTAQDLKIKVVLGNIKKIESDQIKVNGEYIKAKGIAEKVETTFKFVEKKCKTFKVAFLKQKKVTKKN